VHQNVVTISQNFAKFPHHTQSKELIIDIFFVLIGQSFGKIS
jgi:hypothetical protein